MPPSLTRRAALTYLSSLLQQTARVSVALVVTPLVVRGLGGELYGAWVMIQQTVGYLAVSDLRPVGTLKHTLATMQHREDVSEKRRQIGAAVLLWATTLPLMLTLSTLVIVYAPPLFGVDAALVGAVRLALGVTVAGVLLDRIVALPANVLRGVNRDYEALAINATVALLTGLAVGGVVLVGGSLPAVAAVTAAGPLVAAALRYPVARRVLPWFGIEWPARDELRAFARRSGWLFLTALSSLLLIGSDLLLAGLLLGPTAAAVYGMTGAVVRIASEPIAQLVGSANAGVAGLCGRGDFAPVERLREELHLVAIAVCGVLGVGVVLLNEAFVSLWVGSEFFDGRATTLLLLLVLVQHVALRVDGSIVDSLLLFRGKAWLTLGFGGAGLALGALFGLRWGLAGVAAGTLVGRAGLSIALPHIIRRATAGSIGGRPMRGLRRPAAVVATLIAIAAVVAPSVRIASWPALVAAGLATAVASAAAIWFGGLDRRQRAATGDRIRRSRRAAPPAPLVSPPV